MKMIPEMSDLLDVRTVDGLKIYTFKSEEPLAVLVGENRFLMVMAGEYSVEQAIAEALDCFKNKKFRPLKRNSKQD